MWILLLHSYIITVVTVFNASYFVEFYYMKLFEIMTPISCISFQAYGHVIADIVLH